MHKTCVYMWYEFANKLIKEIEIQLSKATRGGICKKKNSDNFKTKFRYKNPTASFFK